MRPATSCPWLLPALAMLASPDALAAGEEELQVYAGGGYATVNADGRTPDGAAGEIDIEYGLSDAWAARLSGSFSLHSVSRDQDRELPGGRVSSQSAILGITYALDVLRLVPAFELGAGVLRIGGDVTRPRVELGVEMGVTADYYLSRRFTVGAAARYVFAPADLAIFPPDFGQTPFFFSLVVRLSRIF